MTTNTEAVPKSRADAGAPAARRIAILIGSTGQGGAERVAATLSNAWAREGREVWLISTYLGPAVPTYRLDARVTVIRLADVISTRQRPRWLNPLRKALALRRVVRTVRPEVVLSFLTNVNVLAATALAATGIPLIVAERTDPAADVELSRVLRMARVLTYPFAKALVVQTAAAARRYGARLRHLRDIQVIHNPLPADLDAAPLRAQHFDDGGLVIGIGRLSPEKQYAGLIEAFTLALGGQASWTLQIWGDGPLREELTQLITRLGMNGRVRLCGATTQPWEALAAAQIFMLSSRYEGFPNAMLEAMALGLPCIAFDCPSGPRELADGGSAAVIVPPGDVSELASALRRVAADPAGRRALGERAAAHVRREFGQQRILADWDRLIGRLLSRDSGPDSMSHATSDGPH